MSFQVPLSLGFKPLLYTL